MVPKYLLQPKSTGITGSVLLIIFRSLISLCFITCLIRISFNLKKDWYVCVAVVHKGISGDYRNEGRLSNIMSRNMRRVSNRPSFSMSQLRYSISCSKEEKNMFRPLRW